MNFISWNEKMQRISSQLKMHLKTQLAVIENSTASLGSKNYFSHSAKCATPYSFGGRVKMTSKIVFPFLQKFDKANNYCKKPSKVIASTAALMLYKIVLVCINFSSSCRAHHNKYHSR